MSDFKEEIKKKDRLTEQERKKRQEEQARVLENTPCPITKERGCSGEDCNHWGYHLPTPKCGFSGIGSSLAMGTNLIAKSISNPERWKGTETEAMTGIKGEHSLAGIIDAVGRDHKKAINKLADAIEDAGFNIKESLYADKKQTVIHKKDRSDVDKKEDDEESSGLPFESVKSKKK